ncbi:MAG: PAS domain-containing protein, partial [Bryobacteraceae bacterium]
MRKASLNHRAAAARKLILLLGPLFIVAAGLLFLAAFAMDVLTSVRAYVNGEALWSKAQKDSIFYLKRYAFSRDEKDYHQYLDAIRVPLGDRTARVELDKPDFDMQVACRGFLEGRNHPDDVEGMARFFRRFRHVSYMEKAIDIWAEADGYIEQLRQEGENLRNSISSGGSLDAVIGPRLAAIDELNKRLTPLEDSFSNTLGEGARRIKSVLLLCLAAGATLLMIGAGGMCYTLLRRVTESEEKYRRLIDSASDAIVVTDRDTGFIVDANPMLERLCGLPVSRLIGTPQAALHWVSGIEEGWEDFVSAVERGEARGRSLRVCHADGRRIPVEVSANLLDVRGKAVVQTIIRDVTERVEAERALRQSNETLSAVIQASPLAIFSLDLNGCVRSWNTAAELTFGWSEQEVLRQVLPIVTEEDREEFRVRLLEASQGAVVSGLE